MPRLLPTGSCWCGCAELAAVGSFFARGHDKVAEAALLATRYGGSVARLLERHGYGPDRSVTDAAVERQVWQRCPACRYAGSVAGVRNHRRRVGH